MKKRVAHLIVDSGAFIKNSPVHEYAENIYSVDGVVKEIKDRATLQRLQVLPYELKLKMPSTESYKHVMEFSKKTGDYSSLSATDLNIIALTYELEKEFVGTEHLNTKPSCQVTNRPPDTGTKPLEGFYYPSNDDSIQEGGDDKDLTEKSSMSEDFSKHLKNHMKHFGDQNPESSEICKKESEEKEQLSSNDDLAESGDVCASGDDDDDDNDESWITPQNLSEVQRRMGDITLDSESEITVACVTTDFAVQNVLLQMGLRVVSVDGYLIKHLKVFILRCFSCFKTTPDSTRQFCPNCGNKTLKKVSVSVADDGSKSIYINFKRPIKKRGMKYSLPMPKGGKHAVNPHLVEDQIFPQNRPSKAALKKVDVLSPDYIASTSPFAVHDIYSRAATFGVYGSKSQRQHQRRNPNEWSKRTGNRKHKK